MLEMNEVTYVQPNHGGDMVTVLNQMRLSKQLCDITITISDKPIYAHRLVLEEIIAISLDFYKLPNPRNILKLL